MCHGSLVGSGAFQNLTGRIEWSEEFSKYHGLGRGRTRPNPRGLNRHVDSTTVVTI